MIQASDHVEIIDLIQVKCLVSPFPSRPFSYSATQSTSNTNGCEIIQNYKFKYDPSPINATGHVQDRTRLDLMNKSIG